MEMKDFLEGMLERDNRKFKISDYVSEEKVNKKNDVEILLEYDTENPSVNKLPKVKKDLFAGYLGELNEAPNPLEYGANATYRNLREGIVYKKGQDNLWEVFVKDGAPGRQGPAAPGGGCGVAEVRREIDTASPYVDVRSFMDGRDGRPSSIAWERDQSIDVTLAVQAAIDSESENYSVIFPGPGIYKFGTVHISDKKNVQIIGSGVIDGLIHIHNTISGTNRDLRSISITGLTWDRGRPDQDINGVIHSDGNSNKNAIHIDHISGVKITRCHFIGVDKCIYVPPYDIGQHMSRSIISECSTGIARSELYSAQEKANAMPFTYQNMGYPNYFYFVDNPNAGAPQAMVAGDVTIKDCNPLHTSVSHIWVHGADGMVITGNTMFMSGGYYRSQIKKQNIFIEYSDWCVIANNELFEAGSESILLHWASDYNISGNNIAWPGQNDSVNGCGIRISGGGIAPAGTRYSCGTISGNNIRQPSKGGIRIDAGHDIVTVVGNTITSAGNTSTYYGDGTHPQGATATPPISASVCYGVSVDPDCYSVVATGNNSPMNRNFLPKSTATSLGHAWHSGPFNLGNSTIYGDASQKTVVEVLSNILKTSGVSSIFMNVVGGCTINTISDGNSGQLLIIYNGSDGVILTNGPLLNLTNAKNCTVPYRNTIVLQNRGGAWFEVSRTFAVSP